MTREERDVVLKLLVDMTHNHVTIVNGLAQHQRALVIIAAYIEKAEKPEPLEEPPLHDFNAERTVKAQVDADDLIARARKFGAL